MLGKRAIRSGRTASRGADGASTPAEAPAQPHAQSSLATAGVVAIDILPARGGRGGRRRKAMSTTAMSTTAMSATAMSTTAAAAPVAVASPAAVATGAAERRFVERVFADARPVDESSFARARAVDEPSFSGRRSTDSGTLEPAPAQVGPLAPPTAELSDVSSLFAAPPAKVADVPTEPIGLAAPVTASGPRVASSAAYAEAEPVVAAVSSVAPTAQDVAAQDAAEAERAPSSLFAPAPSSVVPVPEIVPNAAAVAAAEVPSLVPPAPAGTASGPDTPAQSLRERSAMASQALSELSALSSYRPDGQPGTSAPTARRALPAAGAAGQPTAAGEESLGARRGTRNAADVRSMLSGFRAGGERGRAATAPAASVPEQASAPDES